MSSTNPDLQLGHRPLGRGTMGGLLLTLAVHGGLLYLVYHAQQKQPPAEPAVRDLMVTKMVTLGKPREKFWLPRIVTPPPPVKAPEPVVKVAENPDAAPAAPPPVKPPPKVEDKQISTDLKRALARAKMLAQAAKEEPAEGSLTGSTEGTTSTAEEGDAYATQVHDAIHRNWSAPSGLLNDVQLGGLSAEVRVQIAEDGRLSAPTLSRSSGNDVFDDACVAAVRATGRVPPVPAAARARFRRGVVIEFDGKDLAK
jgi:TonB family protein